MQTRLTRKKILAISAVLLLAIFAGPLQFEVRSVLLTPKALRLWVPIQVLREYKKIQDEWRGPLGSYTLSSCRKGGIGHKLYKIEVSSLFTARSRYFNWYGREVGTSSWKDTDGFSDSKSLTKNYKCTGRCRNGKCNLFLHFNHFPNPFLFFTGEIKDYRTGSSPGWL